MKEHIRKKLIKETRIFLALFIGVFSKRIPRISSTEESEYIHHHIDLVHTQTKDFLISKQIQYEIFVYL